MNVHFNLAIRWGLAALLASAVVYACTLELRFEDISDRKSYSGLVGQTYEIVGVVDLYGLGQHPKPELLYMKLVPRPGFQGRDVAFKVQLPLGTRVTIDKVMWSNRLFENNLTFEVKVRGVDLPAKASNLPIRIELWGGNEDSTKNSLNPDLYRRI